MILHKIYETVEGVKVDLQQLSTDQQRRKFIESIKEDRENYYKNMSSSSEIIPKNPLVEEMTENPFYLPSPYAGKYTWFQFFLATDEVIKFCDEELEFLDQKDQLSNDQPNPLPKKSFLDHLIMNESEKQLFAEVLKKQFPGIGGKELGVLLKALEAEGYINIIDKQRKAIYDSLREFFDWDIKSNTAINRAIYSIDIYKTELESYKKIVQDISKSIK